MSREKVFKEIWKVYEERNCEEGESMRRVQLSGDERELVFKEREFERREI
jgi:hypothetical protein